MNVQIPPQGLLGFQKCRVRVCKLLILELFDRALLVNFPEILVIELKKGFNMQFFTKL